jgi:hypothetical protein
MDEEEREQLTQLCFTIVTEKEESGYVELVAKKRNAATDPQARKQL